MIGGQRSGRSGAWLALVLLTTGLAAPVHAAPDGERTTPARMAAHMRVLAGDAFGGRAPESAGEARTIAYTVGQLARFGLEPLADSATPWLQAMPMARLKPAENKVRLHREGRHVTLASDELTIAGTIAQMDVKDAPLVYVGDGVDAAGKPVEGVAGAVALMRLETGAEPGQGRGVRARREALLRAGALGVIAVAADGYPWRAMVSSLIGNADSTVAVAPKSGALIGVVSLPGFARIMSEGADVDGTALLAKTAAPVTKAVPTNLRIDMLAQTEVTTKTTHNIIARLPGSKPDGRVVLLLAHWDHLGDACAPADVADRICNGAVDNASGVAAVLEVARMLGQGKRPDRDTLILLTTAEEHGLQGAAWFARNAPLPLDKIEVALNLDTIAIAPAGAPVATIGRGNVSIDRVIARVAKAVGRPLDTDGEADAFVTRQDGWALSQSGIPAIMVGGSFSDMKRLEAFLKGPYHTPDDAMSSTVELGGAADDANLHAALVRAFGDTKHRVKR